MVNARCLLAKLIRIVRVGTRSEVRGQPTIGGHFCKVAIPLALRSMNEPVSPLEKIKNNGKTPTPPLHQLRRVTGQVPDKLIDQKVGGLLPILGAREHLLTSNLPTIRNIPQKRHYLQPSIIPNVDPCDD